MKGNRRIGLVGGLVDLIRAAAERIELDLLSEFLAESVSPCNW